MSTAQEVYAADVCRLSRSEQLRLAALILEGLTRSGASALDYSDTWSDEDVRDLSAFAVQQAAAVHPAGPDHA